MTRQSDGRSASTGRRSFRLRQPPKSGRSVSERRLLGATCSGVLFAALAPAAGLSLAGFSPVSAGMPATPSTEAAATRTVAGSTGARLDVVRVDAAKRLDSRPSLAEPQAGGAAGSSAGTPSVRSGSFAERSGARTVAAASAGASDARKPVPVGSLTNVRASDILANPRITLAEGPRRDIVADIVDRRVLALLAEIAKDHAIVVSTLSSGHSTYVKGTNRVSNHVVGRAVDITRVDGEPVSAANDNARDVIETLLGLPAPLRPSEIGSPWDIASTEVQTFTDAGHRSHLHLGFDE